MVAAWLAPWLVAVFSAPEVAAVGAAVTGRRWRRRRSDPPSDPGYRWGLLEASGGSRVRWELWRWRRRRRLWLQWRPLDDGVMTAATGGNWQQPAMVEGDIRMAYHLGLPGPCRVSGPILMDQPLQRDLEASTEIRRLEAGGVNDVTVGRSGGGWGGWRTAVEWSSGHLGVPLPPTPTFWPGSGLIMVIRLQSVSFAVRYLPFCIHLPSPGTTVILTLWTGFIFQLNLLAVWRVGSHDAGTEGAGFLLPSHHWS